MYISFLLLLSQNLRISVAQNNTNLLACISGDQKWKWVFYGQSQGISITVFLLETLEKKSCSLWILEVVHIPLWYH